MRTVQTLAERHARERALGARVPDAARQVSARGAEGPAAVAEDGAVSLVWDQNAEADLGGYLVLRGEAPGDTLQPLTPQPIKDASYRDATVKPGVRYVYVVVAVDGATPRNQSAAVGA